MENVSLARNVASHAAHARAKRTPSRLSVIVSEAFGICPGDLGGGSRGCAKVALARQVGMYLARVSFGFTLSEAGNLFGRDRTTAAYACRVIEDRRDDAGFDALLAAIEVRLAQMAKGSAQ